jgi:hypothetical protein
VTKVPRGMCIPLRSARGGVAAEAIVDDEDYELVTSLGRWCFDRYAVRNQLFTDGRKARLYMHRFIMKPVPGMDIDHINRNKLDNRRLNLRVCMPAQNQMNMPLSRANTSGHRGVTWDRSRSKWLAHISANGRYYHLGRFERIEDAAAAWSRAALDLHGEFAGQGVLP